MYAPFIVENTRFLWHDASMSKESTPDNFKSMSASEKAGLCKEIAGVLVQETEVAIALQNMHEQGAFESAIPDAFNDTMEAWGYNMTIEAIHRDLVMTLMRMFDPPDPGTSSLRTLVRLLGDDDMVSEFEVETRLWWESHSGKDGNWVVEKGVTRAEDHARQRVQKLRSLRSAIIKLEGGHLEASLRKFRNEMLAHRATGQARSVKKPGSRLAKWGDTDNLLKRVLPVIAMIEVAVLEKGSDINDYPNIWHLYARRFWRRAALQRRADPCPDAGG